VADDLKASKVITTQLIHMQHITHNPIDIPSLFQNSHSPNTGAVVLFSGEIRNSNKNKEVLWLEFEAYESMAESTIEAILEEAREKWPLNTAICIHRIGKLDISECAVVVITGSSHRDAAYQANRFIIDEVKRKTPIWKCEYFADGTSEWGANDCQCGTHHHHKAEHKREHQS
jgi:molybdopterin synthase catalytic subunit